MNGKRKHVRRNISVLLTAAVLMAALPMAACAAETGAAAGSDALDSDRVQQAESHLSSENLSEQQSGSNVKDAARAQNFSIRTYNDRRAEDDQNIEVTVTFDRAIEVSAGAESDISVKIAGSPLDQSPNTENGVSNRTLTVKADPQDDTKLIITIGSVPGAAFVKQTNASIQIQASESGISHILTVGSKEPADIKYIETVIPCGLELSTAASQEGKAGGTASVTKKVTHRANVRSMVYIQILKDGQPILPTDRFDYDGSYVIHAHAFIPTASGDTILSELTESDYAQLIVQGFEHSVKDLPELSRKYKMTQKEDKIVLEDIDASEGEMLDIAIYAWPHDGSVISDTPGNDSASETSFFDDVNGWEKEYVYYLAEKGIVKGRTQTQFVPTANVTRAEFVKMLAAAHGTAEEAEKTTSFNDVPASAWYAPYVAWAEKAGIVVGSKGKFRPDDIITKQDMAVMIQRYAEAVGVEIPKMEASSVFRDDMSVASYAKDAVYLLQRASVVSGDINGNFYPQSSATRAQASKMLAVFLQITGK